MNILVLSQLCSPLVYAEIEKQRTVKLLPSQQNYFWRLITAISRTNNVWVRCISIPPVSPSCHRKVKWTEYREIISDKMEINYIGFTNARFQRMFSTISEVNKQVEKWTIDTSTVSSDRYIIVDALLAIYLQGVMKLAKKNKIKVIGIITDLPDYITSTIHSSYPTWKKAIQKIFDNITDIFIKNLDGYIVLTKYINERINTGKKPYLVIEGIAPDRNITTVLEHIDDKRRIVVYAGGLYEKYGINKLVDAFKLINKSDIELHLYGVGDAVEYVKSQAIIDKRIKYCGVIAANDMIDIEEKASLLVNTRSTTEEFTKYSFPSKTIEYMSSGTPVLSTRLPGIPEEYLDYLYWFDGESIDEMSNKLKVIIDKSEEELREFGIIARNFILNTKSGEKIADKVIRFLTLK